MRIPATMYPMITLSRKREAIAAPMKAISMITPTSNIRAVVSAMSRTSGGQRPR